MSCIFWFPFSAQSHFSYQQLAKKDNSNDFIDFVVLCFNRTKLVILTRVLRFQILGDKVDKNDQGQTITHLKFT